MREIEFGSTEKKLAWGCEKILRGHSSDIYDLCWSSDSKYIVSCSIDNSAILFNVQSGKPIQRFEGHRKYVLGVAFDPLMKYIITMSADGTARVYKNCKRKKHLEFYPLKILKRREFTSSSQLNPLSPIQDNMSESNFGGDDASDIEGSIDSKSKYHRLFADECQCPSFFRRLSFSPDGSFCLLPAGMYKENPSESAFKCAVYGFIRANMKKPAFVLPGFKQWPICVKFCPLLFEKDSSVDASQELVEIPYKMVFAVATTKSVYLYNTQSSFPLAMIKNIHYASLTDMSWAKDEYLCVSSSDGYCSIIKFDNDELGKRYSIELIPEKIAHLFKDYDSINPFDISKFAKNTQPKLINPTIIKSAKNKQIQLITVDQPPNTQNNPQTEAKETPDHPMEISTHNQTQNPTEQKKIRTITPILLSKNI